MTHSRKLAVCKFEKTTTTVPIYSGEVDWSEVVAWHKQRDIRATKDGPMLGGYALTGGRKNENVEFRSIIQLDIDAVEDKGSRLRQLFKAGEPPPTLDAIRGGIDRFEWVAASSHRHDPTNEVFKYRIVMLPDRDIQRDEYVPLLEALDEIMDYALDRDAWKWSQAFYLPSCPKETAGDAFVVHNQGVPLPVDEYVARGREILAAREPPRGLDQNVADTSASRGLPETDENIERVKSMLAAIPASVERAAWRDALWGLASLRWESAKDLGVQWSQGCPEKWDAAEFEKIWHSYDADREGGIGFGTLPHLARQYGWDDASRQDTKAASTEHKPSQAPSGTPGLQADRHAGPDTPVEVDWSLKADLRHAKLFSDLYRGKLLYVHDRGKWLRWCDGRWHWCTEEEEMEAAKHACTFLLKAAGKLAREDQEKASKLIREAAEAHKLPRIKAMLELARSVPGMKTSYAMLDKDAHLLGVSNGVVDLRRAELLDNTPDRRITRYCAGAYRPDAACPRWLAFLDEIFQGDQDTIDAVQRLLGLSLTGLTTEEVMVFCVGSGANGKSIFGNVVAVIMGDYAVTAPPSLLAARRSDDTAPRSDLAMLAGARMASVNELPCGMKLDETVAKQLAGREPIAARFMYGEFFAFRPTFTPWVRTNHKPIVKGVDEGIWRRLIILRFGRTFAPDEQDPKLEQALLAERDGILSWMVRGAQLYLTAGLRMSAAMTREIADYRDASDVLGEFLSTCTEEEATHKVEQGRLYSAWKIWCETNGHHPCAKATFTERLAERGYKTAKSGPDRYYVGLKIINPLASG